MNAKALQRFVRGLVRLAVLALGGAAIGCGVLGAAALANAFPVAAWTAGAVFLLGVLTWILGGES